MVIESDESLINMLRESNIERPIKILYKHYFDGVVRHVSLNGGSNDDGADIFQEAILALIDKIKSDTFRGESSIKTFLMAIARNLWLLELRTRSRRKKREEEYIGDTVDEVVGNDYEFFNKDNVSGLSKVFENIGETCKKLLVGFYYEKKSMAELLGNFDYDNEQVLRNKKSKCMKKIKELIQSDSSLENNLKLIVNYGR